MLRLGRRLGFAVALAIALAPDLKAAGICPPRISAYKNCPGNSRQSWPIPALPSYIDTDTVVVKRQDEGVWEYYSCLKSTTPVEEEFEFLWPDLKSSLERTGCGGFWGNNLTSTHPPVELQSFASVGPDLWPIHPQIKKPAGPLTSLWYKFIEYISQYFASLYLDKEGKTAVTVELTVRSTASPVLKDGRQMATQYEIAYSNRYEVESSASFPGEVAPIRFLYSEELVEQAVELEGLFSLDDPRPVKFTKIGPPSNLIGAIVFVDRDGYEVGSMPVSLALPSE